mmetsp:Transcript_36665/g.101888  ORF Transcript_36665/g.101888 Transcript_36665/m.101888 type:complete len:283 (+) Transcript_36665:620-1468(+)
MVHPLGEEPAVQGHLPPVHGRHLVQAGDKRDREYPGGLDRVRGHRCHQRGDVPRVGHRAGHLALQAAHQVLALVAATDRVEARCFKAIGPGTDVIGHNHHRAARVGLVECAQHAEVVDLLVEVPMAVQGPVVEVRQLDAASLPALHLQESGLEAATLGVIEVPILLSNLLHDASGGSKLDPAIPRGNEVGCLNRPQPVLDRLPVIILHGKRLQLLICLLRCGSRGVGNQVAHEVQLHCLLGLFEANSPAFGQLQSLVSRLQPRPRIFADKVLKRCRKGRELT